MADIINPQLELAAKAADKVVKYETFVALIDIDTLTAAEFLCVRSWAKRGVWFDGIIVDSFKGAVGLSELLDDKTLFPEIIAEMRKQITKILDHLERLGPLELNGDAMRIFRVCDDPERVALAVRSWRDQDAELAAMRAGSGCMVLRNVSIAPYAAPSVRKHWGLQ